MSKRKQLIIVSSAGGAILLLVILGLAWGPMQRSSQLGAIDACTEPEQARTLATAFAESWGAGSEHVRGAIAAGRGPVEARLVWCRLGHHRDLCADLLARTDLKPAQRAEVLSTLAADWPAEGKGAPALPPAVADWASAVDADPAVAAAAVRLLLAAGLAGGDQVLARMAVDPALSAERAKGAAEALAAWAERHGGDVVPALLAAATGPHRAVVQGSDVVVAAIGAGASPAHATRLLALLGESGTRPIALAGLSGPRMELPVGNAAVRGEFARGLEPYLAAEAADPVLAGALRVVKRQRLVEVRERVLALMPRLSSHAPAGLERGDIAEILGHTLVSTADAAATAAAEDLVAGLAARLADPGSRPLAAAALARVQESSLKALRSALDTLAAQAGDAGCREALAQLVGRTYNRDDIVTSAGRVGWAKVLADDARRHARFDAMHAWIAAHGEDTTVRADNDKLVAARKELVGYRDELRVWAEPSMPTPLGISRAAIDGLANKVNLMLGMVNKAFGAGGGGH